MNDEKHQTFSASRDSGNKLVMFQISQAGSQQMRGENQSVHVHHAGCSNTKCSCTSCGVVVIQSVVNIEALRLGILVLWYDNDNDSDVFQ